MRFKKRCVVCGGRLGEGLTYFCNKHVNQSDSEDYVHIYKPSTRLGAEEPDPSFENAVKIIEEKD